MELAMSSRSRRSPILSAVLPFSLSATHSSFSTHTPSFVNTFHRVCISIADTAGSAGEPTETKSPRHAGATEREWVEGGGGIHRQKEGWKGGWKRGRKKGLGVWGCRRKEKGAGKMDRQISGRSKGASKRCPKTSQEKSEKRRERVRESCVKRSVSEMLPCWRPRPNCARA